jgi:hypothetical protein
MKAKFMIAPLISTIGYMLLSLSTPSILNAQTRDYGTTRQPRTCPTRSQPTKLTGRFLLILILILGITVEKTARFIVFPKVMGAVTIILLVNGTVF